MLKKAKCMTIFRTFLFLALFSYSAFSYDLNDFENSNVLLKNENGQNYYLVLAKSTFHFNESKLQKEAYLTLKVKGNLANFLNEKNGEEFSYIFKGFLPITYFENEKSAGIIAKIAQNNIKKTEKIEEKPNFEDFIKSKIQDLPASDILRFEDDYYLVTYASVDAENLSLQKRVQAIRAADMKSQKEFLAFIKGEDIQVLEKLKRIFIDNNGTVSEAEEFNEMIKAKANGYIKKQKTLNFQENGLINSITYMKMEF